MAEPPEVGTAVCWQGSDYVVVAALVVRAVHFAWRFRVLALVLGGQEVALGWCEGSFYEAREVAATERTGLSLTGPEATPGLGLSALRDKLGFGEREFQLARGGRADLAMAARDHATIFDAGRLGEYQWGEERLVIFVSGRRTHAWHAHPALAAELEVYGRAGQG
jgi:hypothetical protein